MYFFYNNYHMISYMGRPRLATSDLHVRISNLIQKGLFMETKYSQKNWPNYDSKYLNYLFFFRRMQHCSTLLTACYSSCRVKIIISSMSDNLKFLLFSSFICNNFFIINPNTRVHNMEHCMSTPGVIIHSSFIYSRHQKDTQDIISCDLYNVSFLLFLI